MVSSRDAGAEAPRGSGSLMGSAWQVLPSDFGRWHLHDDTPSKPSLSVTIAMLTIDSVRTRSRWSLVTPSCLLFVPNRGRCELVPVTSFGLSLLRLSFKVPYLGLGSSAMPPSHYLSRRRITIPWVGHHFDPCLAVR